MYNKYSLITPYDFVLSAIKYPETEDVEGATEPIFIPLHVFIDNSKPSLYSTYAETLTEKENSLYTLSFSISMYGEGGRNPLIDLIVNKRKLRLQLFDDTIDFVITGIQPKISSQNIIYAVTAQDVFSTDSVKMGTGLTYDSTDDDLYPDEDIGPFNIKELTKKVLEYGKCTLWAVDESLCSGETPDFPTSKIYHNGIISEAVSSLTLSNSNIYNAIVAVASSFNARIKITYNDNGIGGTISYENIADDKFTGYRLRNDSNLTALSYSTKSSDYYPIMYVTGGEDSNGYTVSILPSMPTSLQTFLYSDTVYDNDMDIASAYSIMGAPTLAINSDDEVIFKYNSKTVEPDTNEVLGTLYFHYKKDDKIHYSIYEMTFSSTEPTDTNLAYVVVERDNTDGDTIKYYAIYKRTDGDVIDGATTWEDAEVGKLKSKVGGLLASSTYNDSYTDAEKTEILNYCESIDTEVPAATSMFYNFDYAYNNGLMPLKVYETLNLRFGQELRNINMQLQFATQKYYELTASVSSNTDLLEEAAMLIAANNEEVVGLITDPATTIVDANNYYTHRDTSLAEAETNLSSILATIGTTTNLILFKQLNGANWIGTLKEELAKVEEEYRDYCYEARKEMNALLDAKRIELGDTTLSDSDAASALAENWVEYSTYAGYLSTYNKYKVYLDEDVYFTLGDDLVPTGKYAYGYIGSFSSIDEVADAKRVFGNKLNCLTYTREGYFTSYYKILTNIKNLMSYKSINNLPSGLYSIKDFYENLQEKQNVFWTEIYSLYGNYLLSTTYSDSTQLESSALYIAALQQFTTYMEPTPSYSASVVRYEELVDTFNAPVHVGNYVYLYNELLFKEKSSNIAFVITIEGQHKKEVHSNVKWTTNKSDITIVPSFTEEYIAPHDGKYYTRIFCKIKEGDSYLVDKNKTFSLNTIGLYKIVKLDYNYESVPVKLHVTAITSTLNAKTISLTLSDTARTDALLGKLLYMVRKN